MAEHLSPGKHYLRVPVDRIKNCKYRQRIYEIADNDKAVQAKLMRMCAEDFVFWVSTFAFQFNPKLKGADRVGPYIAWQCQIDAILARPETHADKEFDKGIIWCYEHNRSAVIQKSREMGISWLFLLFQVWLCIFHNDNQILNISCSADAVDCGSPDSLFWKIRYCLQHLPTWMVGRIGEPKSKPDVAVSKMLIEFKRTNSFITGVASTGIAGVGGRASMIFIDEFPLIKEASEVRERTANTSDCRFFNGTHQGTDSEFYRLTDRKVSPEIVLVTVHWTQHPLKNPGLYRYNPTDDVIEFLDGKFQVVSKPTCPYPEDYEFDRRELPAAGPHPGVRSKWYDWKVSDIGSIEGAARELDIDPGGSSSKYFNEILINSLIRDHTFYPTWTGELLFDPSTGRPVANGLLSRPDGPLRLWMAPTGPDSVRRDRYTAGADISMGRGKTPTVMSFWSVTTGERLAEFFSSRIKPYEFAPYAAALLRLFADHDGEGAWFAWEKLGPGNDFSDVFMTMGYNRIYRQKTEQPITGTVVYSDSPGWTPTTPGFRFQLDRYQRALTMRTAHNYSAEALRECLDIKTDEKSNPVHNNIKSKHDPSGAGVSHTDRVVADMLGWMMVLEQGGGKAIKTDEVEQSSWGSMAGRRSRREDAKRLMGKWGPRRLV